MKNQTNSYDIIIVGAGVAGGAMAAYLGDHGFRVAVVEKDMREPDRIVGELMQPGGVEQLWAMGLYDVLDGYDAQVITGYALYLRDRHFSIDYPGGETGRGLRNGKLLTRMRERLLSSPNITVIEGTALSLIEDHGIVRGLLYMPKDSPQTHGGSLNACPDGTAEAPFGVAVDPRPSSLFSPLTIVCDGMFSTFRERLADTTKTVSSYFLGLILRDCTLPFAGHGHVIAAEPSPVLVYPVSSTETRVLIDFPADQPPRRGEELTAYLRDRIGPQMPPDIQPSFYKAVAEGKSKVMPNHLIPARPRLKPGAVLVGDSLNMRHPLTGGGMTVALTDVHDLGERLIAIRDSFSEGNINEAVAQFYEQHFAQNASVNILADALYKVMSDADLKEACYTYLAQGGDKAGVPLSLLAATSRDSSKLLMHFFGVAVHGARQILLPQPSPAKIGRSYRMIKNAVHIISPLLFSQKPGTIAKVTLMTAEKAIEDLAMTEVYESGK